LRELQAITGGDRYLFPGMRTKTDPISDGTLVNALRRLGYGPDDFCAHSFRSMASTLLHENGFNSDWIEVQLSHKDRNPIKAAYNHALYWEDRKKMMAWWGDYLESLTYARPNLRLA
jgi:integrase